MKPLVGQKFIIKNTIIQLVFHNSNELEYKHMGNRFPHFLRQIASICVLLGKIDGSLEMIQFIKNLSDRSGALQMDEEIELEQ